jgi:hypothetical protein
MTGKAEVIPGQKSGDLGSYAKVASRDSGWITRYPESA